MHRWFVRFFGVHSSPVMQRSLRRSSILLLALALSSCAAPPPALEAGEVLRRAIIRSSAIDSASISASASVLLKGYSTFSGSAVIQGVLRGSGGWSADISFQGRDSAGRGEAESGTIKVLSLDGSQIFLNPKSLQGPLLHIVSKSLTGSVNGWWVMGQPSPIPTGGRHTLSPAELDETASLFRIDGSSGPSAYAGRRTTAYRIAVTLTPDALRALFAGAAKDKTAISGVLWIDAEDFTLLRATWNLADILTSFGPADILLDVVLGDINRAPEIVPPTGSSATLLLNSVFDTISH